MDSSYLICNRMAPTGYIDHIQPIDHIYLYGNNQ